MRKKEILFWVVFGFFAFGLGFGITALVDHYNSKPKATLLNPDGVTEKQAAVQAQAVSEGLTYYSKNASANLEEVLNEMKNMKSHQTGNAKLLEKIDRVLF